MPKRKTSNKRGRRGGNTPSAPASAPFAARPGSTAKTFKGTVKDTATNALNLVKRLFGGGKSRRHKRRSRKRHTRKRKRAKSHKKRKHKHVRH